MGPRGIGILEKIFRDVQFKGKGFESDDLNRLMKYYEHWAHRMMPSMTFDDSIKQIEKVGSKKSIKVLYIFHFHCLVGSIKVFKTNFNGLLI